MNKELFVSSTPHETKVGLVEDDLLAEIYLERENEYTLAGSIYKGRVTRVLPGMQSAFVDIGLERDAFLYVSDFMELEEHDEDLTDTVPAARVPDQRPAQYAAPRPAEDHAADRTAASVGDGGVVIEGGSDVSDELEGDGSTQAAGSPESSGNAGDLQNRERGGYRGRRRRRGGRRDGRGDGRGADRNSERGSEPRVAEPAAEDRGSEQERPSERSHDRGHDRGQERGQDRGQERGASYGSGRGSESRYGRGGTDSGRSREGRTQHAGPPPGYQPILLPGESISKYQRFAQPAAAAPQTVTADVATSLRSDSASDSASPLNAAFPEDEPIFAAAESVAEPLHEEHEDIHASHEEPAESASTTTDWNHEFRNHEFRNQEFRNQEFERPEVAIDSPPEGISAVTVEPPIFESASQQVRTDEAATDEGTFEEETIERAMVETPSTKAIVEEVVEDEDEDSSGFNLASAADQSSHSSHSSQHRDEPAPVFAAPGTMEEETIDEEEADTIRYESSSDEGYEEFEEETRAAGGDHLNGEAREAVSEIHMASLTEAGHEGAEAHAATPEGEDDSEELELEEAQAEAEAMLDAEARGNGTVDARVEVRAPAATAGLTQRAPRPAWERRGQRGRRGGSGGGGRPRGGFRRRESAPVPLISDLLKEGQEILVQIAKEPIGKKGARITSHIALPGRFLVYMPTVNHTGVSRKIASDEERQRLKRIIMSERENGHGGFIVRTAAQNASEDELRADIRFLKGLWQDIKNRAESSKPPALIYHDLNVVERVLRDQVTADFNVIWVDTEPEYERILRFFNRFQPGMVKRVKLYTKETPLFEQFGLAEEMNKALKSKVWLKSGGYIVINQTEALVAIDINTGKYVGKTARLEDTIVKTNVDAIKEIVRQIRLRDLGGIIIIDFIDMDERRNRQRVMQALEEELRHDRAPSKTLQFNDFGLVAITRKRVKQSLERTIGAPCPYCESTGYVKSVTTVCNEIYVEMRKIAKHLEHEDVMLRVHPDVAKELKTNNGRLLNEMEELTKRTIIVKSDPAVHQQQFDIN
jgi:Rne/Rng family ribonuclease